MLDCVALNGSFEDNDFEGIWKEAVLDEVEEVSGRLPLETEEYHETFQDNMYLCICAWVLNPRRPPPPEYEVGLITT